MSPGVLPLNSIVTRSRITSGAPTAAFSTNNLAKVPHELHFALVQRGRREGPRGASTPRRMADRAVDTAAGRAPVRFPATARLGTARPHTVRATLII